MPVEFGYAQARSQAQQGDRLPKASWQAVEASDGLAQYLHSIRATTLTVRVSHFAANSSPHAIERSLRRDWRAAVHEAAHWVPDRWRESVNWAAWLPDLPVIAYLLNNGDVLSWMHDDPVISSFALSNIEARHQALERFIVRRPADTPAEAFDLLPWWTREWHRLWPDAEPEGGPLIEFERLLQSHYHEIRDPAETARSARARTDGLTARITRLLHIHTRQPVTVFYHLALTALELQRLRGGLVRRALHNIVEERAG